MPNNDNNLTAARSIAAELSSLLEDSNIAEARLGNHMQNRIKGMQRLVKLEQERGALSNSQLGWMKGSVTVLQSELVAQEKMKKFHSATNAMLTQNKDLYKSMSDEQKSAFQSLLKISKDTSETSDSRIQAEKSALILLQDQKKVMLAQEEVLERQNEALSEYTQWVDDAKKKWTQAKDVIKGMLTSPWAAATVAAGVLFKKLTGAFEAAKSMKEQLGLSVIQTAKLAAVAGEATAKSLEYGASLEDSMAAITAIASETGNLDSASAETVANMTKFSSLTGQSAEETAKLYTTFSEMPGMSEQAANGMMDMARNMSNAYGVPLDKVMADVSANTEAFAIAGAAGAEQMLQATIMANKLGVSMSALWASSKGMLDIESSLNSEMEASALLGKEISFDKARQAAHDGDMVAYATEIAKQVGTTAEWEKMGRVEKEAMAEAAGLTVDELSKVVKNQDLIAGMTKEEYENWLATNGQLEAQVEKKNWLAKLTEKDNLMLIASLGVLVAQSAQLLFQSGLWGGILNKVGKGTGIFGKMAGFLKGGMPGGAGGPAPAAGKVKTPPSAGKGLTSLASGLTKMGTAKVTAGAANLMLAGLAFVVMTPGIPAMAGVAGLGKKAGSGLGSLGTGLSKMSKGAAGAAVLMLAAIAFTFMTAGILGLAAVAALGSLAGSGLAALGTGLVAFAQAMAVTTPIGPVIGVIAMAVGLIGMQAIMLGAALAIASPGIEAFGTVVTAVFNGLAVVIPVIADAFISLLNSLNLEKIAVMYALGPAMAVVGAGGAALMMGVPGIIAGGVALGGMGAVLTLFKSGFEMLPMISSSIVNLVSVTPGIFIMAEALGVLALSMTALAGSLVLLAPMLPVLAAAQALGVEVEGTKGEEGGNTETAGNAEIIAKLDELITAVKMGAVIQMDGAQVGKAVVKFVNLNSGSTSTGGNLFKF